jgi:hypothetical protein
VLLLLGFGHGRRGSTATNTETHHAKAATATAAKITPAAGMSDNKYPSFSEFLHREDEDEHEELQRRASLMNRVTRDHEHDMDEQTVRQMNAFKQRTVKTTAFYFFRRVVQFWQYARLALGIALIVVAVCASQFQWVLFSIPAKFLITWAAICTMSMSLFVTLLYYAGLDKALLFFFLRDTAYYLRFTRYQVVLVLWSITSFVAWAILVDNNTAAPTAA